MRTCMGGNGFYIMGGACRSRGAIVCHKSKDDFTLGVRTGRVG